MAEKVKNKIKFPHPIVIFISLIMLACLATYIVPAGQYDYIEGTTSVDPDSFHFIENTPVNPIAALFSLQSSLEGSGMLMSLLFIVAASTEILIVSGAVNSIVNTGIKRFGDKSIKIVIPLIYALMSVLGALCGNDAMIAYVAIGLIISVTLKLDAICAIGMFYLPYITAQAAGPTTMIVLTAQSLAGVEPLSGIGVQLVLEVIFYIWGAFFVTRYALKVNRDPSKSILGDAAASLQNTKPVDMTDAKFGIFEWKALLSILATVGGYVAYVVGSSLWGWSWSHLAFCILCSGAAVGVFYRMNINDFFTVFTNGVRKIAPVVLFIGFAKIIGTTLVTGNIIHTIAYGASSLLSGLNGGFGAVGIFLFNLLFNFLVTSGTSQAAIVIPITAPMGDVLGVSRELVVLAMQLGDSLSNCLTPLSGALAGALAIASVDYPVWIKFVIKFSLVNIAIASVAIYAVHILGIL